MPNKIKPKRSYTANAVPVVSGNTPDIEQHEMAVNWTDGKLFTRDANNQLVSITLGGSGGGGSVLAEYATTSQFPATGVAATLYCATDAGRLYRWTGSVYAELGSVGGEDTTLRGLLVPPAPTNVAAIVGNAQVALSWTAPTVLAQTPITDYIVQFSSNSGSTWTTFSDGTSTATSATVTGLTNGTAYVFRVAAVNGAGTGSPSAATSSVTPTSGDPFFASVSLLLHADGTGSTFIDSSPTPKTITAYGNATQSATQSRWGGKSAYFDGDGDYLTADSSAMAFGTGDFCIECWLFITAAATNHPYGSALFDTRGISQGYSGFALFLNSSGVLTTFDANSAANASASSSVPFSQWVHIAAARSSGQQRVYVNGASVLSYSSGYNHSGTQLTIASTVDYRSSGSSFKLTGYIDDFRVTASARNYTGTTITVPTAAFPDA